MAVFILSLAGLPPLAGFFGKFYLFSVALRAGDNQGLVWLVAIALFGSFISLYYYLVVLKVIFVEPALSEVERNQTWASLEILPTPADFLQKISLSVLAIIVLLLGVIPAPFVARLIASVP